MYIIMALIHFALIGDDAYEEVIPISSLILSKLDLERLKLVLRTLLLHIALRIYQNFDKILPYFWPKCVRKCVFAYT